MTTSAEDKRRRRARGICLSCRRPAVKGRSRCEWHLESERARQRRVQLLAAKLTEVEFYVTAKLETQGQTISQDAHTVLVHVLGLIQESR